MWGMVVVLDAELDIFFKGTAGMGHYTCYAMNDCDGQWYEYDDVYVTQVDASTVANCEAYVLFYR